MFLRLKDPFRVFSKINLYFQVVRRPRGKARGGRTEGCLINEQRGHAGWSCASKCEVVFARVFGLQIAGFKFFRLGLLLSFLLFFPSHTLARIYIDINAPSVRKFNIAIPDFKNLNVNDEHPELAGKLSSVISTDLDLSGYFNPMDKGAFLKEDNSSLPLGNIRFKDWSVIGAELLLKASFICTGKTLEVQARLFDVFWGKQILGKRISGDISHYRYMMHRFGDEIIRTLTGHESIFLSKLAFVGNASGNKEIYICDYDGHNLRPFTADKSISLLPRWSPDGKKLIYNSYKEGSPMLYMGAISGGADKRISTRSGLNIGASWAPSGNKMALTLSRKGNPDIFIIDLNGKIVKRLTNHWGIDVSPAFSPNGKKIAFVSNRSGSPQIYILDLINGTEERLTFKGKYNTSPSWSSLNRIAFVSRNDQYFDICTIDPDGSRLRRLTEHQGNNEDPCWSPDGRYIIFCSNRAKRNNLYIMTANGQSQRKIINLSGGDCTSPSWAP